MFKSDVVVDSLRQYAYTVASPQVYPERSTSTRQGCHLVVHVAVRLSDSSNTTSPSVPSCKFVSSLQFCHETTLELPRRQI